MRREGKQAPKEPKKNKIKKRPIEVPPDAEQKRRRNSNKSPTLVPSVSCQFSTSFLGIFFSFLFSFFFLSSTNPILLTPDVSKKEQGKRVQCPERERERASLLAIKSNQTHGPSPSGVPIASLPLSFPMAPPPKAIRRACVCTFVIRNCSRDSCRYLYCTALQPLQMEKKSPFSLAPPSFEKPPQGSAPKAFEPITVLLANREPAADQSQSCILLANEVTLPERKGPFFFVPFWLSLKGRYNS